MSVHIVNPIGDRLLRHLARKVRPRDVETDKVWLAQDELVRVCSTSLWPEKDVTGGDVFMQPPHIVDLEDGFSDGFGDIETLA